MIVVLYSSNDTSRNFPALIPPGGADAIYDVSKDDMSAYLGPSWSSLPSVVVSVSSSGQVSPVMVGLIENPPDWATVLKVASAADNQSLLTSISAWGSSVGGTAIQGPLFDLFETGIFTAAGLNLDARLNLPLTFPLLERYSVSQPDVVATYWAGLKAKPPLWLDDYCVQFVENLAQLYSIPLLPVKGA